jgi:DNA-binding LytR/AlgR family response regulator
MNGMDVACQIRSNDSKTHIIFVTNRDDLVFKCFQFRALRFIRKNHLDEELKEAIETLKHEIDMTNIVYRVLSNKKLVSYPIDSILYFESNKHYIDIHLLDRIDTIRKNIKEVEQDLSNSGFIRTHVGYIVNYKYISSIEKSQVILFNPLSDNTTINVPISRNKYKSVQERYMYFSRRD